MRSSFFCLSVFCLVSSLYLESLLIIGSNTPASLLDELWSFPYKYNISYKHSEGIKEDLEKFDFNLLIDITFQQLFYPLLDDLASHFNTFYFSLSPTETTSWSSHRFNLHSSYLQQTKAIQILINYLNWTDFSLISSNDYFNLKLADHLNTEMEIIIDSYSRYSCTMPQNDSDNFVARILKAETVRRLVIIDKGMSLDTIQTSIANTKFSVEGSSFILPSESIYSVQIDGSLILVESGLENSHSSDNYHHLAILNAISKLKSKLSKFSIIQKDIVFKTAKELYPYHVTCNSYSLINFHNRSKIIVGEIKDQLSLTGLIYYPKNITIPIQGDTKLVISISNTTKEIYNLYTYTGFINVNNGALFAVNQINSNKEIPGYEISLFSTGCGVFLYDPAWYTDCYSKVIDKLGIAYVNSPWFMATYGDIITLKSLGKNVPQISITSIYNSSLDNKQEFPEFVELSSSIKNIFANANIFYSSVGWFYQCIITDRGQDYLNSILESTNGYNIKYMNSHHTRLFPGNYSRKDFYKYKSYFQEIKDSKCGLLLIFTTTRLPYYEALYDIGLRKGNIQIIADLASASELNTPDEEIYRNKWIEIGGNHIIIGRQAYNGDFGIKLKMEMVSFFGAANVNGGGCYTYDAISVLKNAIQYIISKGGNLEDPTTFMLAVRATKIKGCTGSISFDPLSNSQFNFPTLISQAKLREDLGIYYALPCVLIQPLSNVALTYMNHFDFPNGIPLTIRPNDSCPFDSYLIVDSPKGMYVLYSLSFIFLIISIIAAYYGFKKFESNFEAFEPQSTDAPREKKVATLADLMFMSYFALQYFQIVNHGPNQIFFNLYLNQFLKFLSIDFIECYNLSYSKFWKFYEALLLFCTVWIFICLSKIYFPNLIKNIQINEHILPVIGNISFMPLLSMLIDVYICDKSISDSLTDSYLKFDCTSFCYIGSHLMHAIFATFVITAFLFLTIYLRLLWENIQSCLHFCTNPLYMSISSVVQVLVVIVSKLLNTDQEIINGWILCLILGLFIGITIRVKPYNDDRLCSFQLISLSCCLWQIFITTTFKYLTYSIVWVALEALGLGIILIVGFTKAYKKDSVIYFEKNISISIIFYDYFNDNCFNFSKSERI